MSIARLVELQDIDSQLEDLNGLLGDLPKMVEELNEKETSNSVYLAPGASLVIRDYDLDSDTLNDQSKLRSDVTGKGNYTEKFNYTVNVGCDKNAKLNILNSQIEYINSLQISGEGSYVKNSSFMFLRVL